MAPLNEKLDTFLATPTGNGGEGLDLARTVAGNYSLGPVPESLRAADDGLLVLAEQSGAKRDRLLACAAAGKTPTWFDTLQGEVAEIEGVRILAAPCSEDNAYALQHILPNLRPAPLGLAPSFGFGDRIGLATPGHAAAMRAEGAGLAPIFAQQSIREMQRTERTPRQVMADATWGALRAGWTGPVGADADHLKTAEDVASMADAGFTFFTIDPSDHVDQHADDYTPAQVDEKFDALLADKVQGANEILGLYAGKSFDLGAAAVVLDEPTLKRAAVKYGRALAHIYAMAGHAARAMDGRGFELEISVDETEQPTTIPEHLFLAMELKRHEVPVVSLAPRFIGDFEKGIDYKGDLARFEADLVLHAAIAQAHGPYKISLHSGSDKFGVYPLIGRVTNQTFHVKTAGTSYLEALRAVCRTDAEYFREIAAFCRGRFDTDRATYHISAALDDTPDVAGLTAGDLEKLYLDEDNGRQILHVTFGSVLTVLDGNGEYKYRDRIKDLLLDNRSLHDQVLESHLGKHLRLLCGGEG